MNNQGDANQFRIDRIAVSPVATFSERITMIGRQDNNAVIIGSARFEKAHKLAKCFVDSCEFRNVPRLKAVIRTSLRRSAVELKRYLVKILRLRIDKIRLAALSLLQVGLQLRQSCHQIVLLPVHATI